MKYNKKIKGKKERKTKITTLNRFRRAIKEKRKQTSQNSDLSPSYSCMQTMYKRGSPSFSKHFAS